MKLPTGRNNTYVNGVSEVDANDLNAVQDLLIRSFGAFFHDDFFLLDTTRWVTTGQGSPSTTISANDHLLVAVTSNAGNDDVNMHEADEWWHLPSLPRVRAGFLLVSALTNRILQIGLFTAGVPDPTPRVAFVYDSSVDGNIHLHVEAEDTNTYTADTGVAVAADTSYIVDAEVLSSTQIRWGVYDEDGAELASGTLTLASTTIEASTTAKLGLHLETLTVAAVTAHVDFIECSCLTRATAF